MLDNDLYKYTMQQLVLHNFPNTKVEYDLSIRSKNVDLRPFRQQIERELIELSSFQLQPEEISYLKSIRFISDDYVEWLSNFRFNPQKHISISERNDNLFLIIRGDWLHTILYEVPVLAIISEAYSTYQQSMPLKTCTELLNAKVEFVKSLGPEFKFADFGTRRRFSYMIQDHVVETLSRELPSNFVGTSNVHFAMKYGVKTVGTMAHEILQCSQALFPLPTHQKDMFYRWSREFVGDLGYALSDTLGSDYFLKDFTLDLAKLFDGTRQDSGDPFEYGEKIIRHYERLGINPKSKYVVFSDALDLGRARDLFNYFKDRINVSFGIGTFLTNDCGIAPLSIVIKVQNCNGIPVVKLSDNPEKAMGRDKNYLEFIKSYVKSIT